MNALQIANLHKHTNMGLLPSDLHADFIEGCELDYHIERMDYTTFCDHVDKKVNEWLSCEAWVAKLVEPATLTFDWDFEDVGDRVVTGVVITLDDKQLQDDDFMQAVQDVKNELGMTKARAFAKRYAKQHGYKFANVEPDTYGYRRALMECANRNR